MALAPSSRQPTATSWPIAPLTTEVEGQLSECIGAAIMPAVIRRKWACDSIGLASDHFVARFRRIPGNGWQRTGGSAPVEGRSMGLDRPGTKGRRIARGYGRIPIALRQNGLGLRSVSIRRAWWHASTQVGIQQHARALDCTEGSRQPSG